MARAITFNSSKWKLVTFHNGKLGRCYMLVIPDRGKKVFTEAELLDFFDRLPDERTR